MIIGCSECGTRYVVGPKAIGKEGRRVKCSKCNNVWFQEPAPEDHEIVPGPEELAKAEAKKETLEQEPKKKDENRESDGKEEKTGKDEDDLLGIFGGDVSRNVPVIVKERYYKQIIGWVALVFFVVSVVSGLYYFRKDIELNSDFAKEIYKKWDALVLKENQNKQPSQSNPTLDVEPHPSSFLSMRQSAEVRLEESRPSLYITIEIRNSSTIDIELPAMQGFIRDAAGVDIFTWSQSINPSIVPANDILQFEVIVDNIPAETVEAKLVFKWPESEEN